MGGHVEFTKNHALGSTEGLSGLTSVGGDLVIWENDSLERVAAPALERVGSGFTISDNPSLDAVDDFPALTEVAASLSIPLAETVCVGDDAPDLAIMNASALGIAVADAHPDVLAAADWITTLPGGAGAVRQVCDMLLDARGRTG